VRRLFSRFISDEAGATAIEYALIAAGISVAIVGAVQALGVSVTGNFSAILAGLESLKR
jgi:pilus assembly protein Flp/PilA